MYTTRQDRGCITIIRQRHPTGITVVTTAETTGTPIVMDLSGLVIPCIIMGLPFITVILSGGITTIIVEESGLGCGCKRYLS